jgi:hypothetical protein
LPGKGREPSLQTGDLLAHGGQFLF